MSDLYTVINAVDDRYAIKQGDKIICYMQGATVDIDDNEELYNQQYEDSKKHANKIAVSLNSHDELVDALEVLNKVLLKSKYEGDPHNSGIELPDSWSSSLEEGRYAPEYAFLYNLVSNVQGLLKKARGGDE